MAKSRRRLFLEELLLLLVRALLIGCVAMVMIRPAFHPKSTEGSGIVRQGGTASVLLIDDSVSSTAGRAQPAFETMKKLGLGYLDSLAPGDEVSVLLMSQLGAPSNDPLFDIEALKASLTALKPSFVATDIAALLDTGLSQLKRHINPGAELVLLTDGRKDGWHEQDRARWDDLRERLHGTKNAVLGTKQRPRVIVLSPNTQGMLDDNLSISAIGMDRTLVSAGRPAGIRVTVANYGQAAREANVQLSVNGQVIGSKRLEVSANGQQEALIVHTFDTPGSYGLEAALVDHQDQLSADDRRALSIQVEASLPVLLVDGGLTQGLESKLGFLIVALDPEMKGQGPFQVTRIPLTQLTPSILQGYRVVALGDLHVLEPAMVDALERFVVSGGGVLVGLGPDSDMELINRFWARNGEGLLPVPLKSVEKPEKPALPAAINLGHPVFSGFGLKNDEAWKAAKVKTYFKLDTKQVKPADLDVLLRMDNEDPLIIERRRGLGLVALVATSLNADWTDLPLQAAYVPMMRGVVGHLGSFIMPPRNLRPGEPITYARVKDPTQAMQGEDPLGKPLKLTLGAWEGRDAIVSDPLMEPGIYLLHEPTEASAIRYAVSLAPAESALLPVGDTEITQIFESGATLLHNPDQIAQNLDPARRQSVELWKWFLLGAILLMFLEAWMTRREAKGGLANA